MTPLPTANPGARPSRRFAGSATALFSALLLAACAQQPRLGAPVTTELLPAHWPALQTQAAAAGQGNAAQLAWEHFFLDPTLRELIQASLNHNRDLRLALLRVDEARAAYQIQNAERVPHIGASGNFARARVPGDMNPSGRAVTSGDHELAVGLSSWELDLWGRVKSLSDAALSNYLAIEANQQAVQAALIKQVALTYLALRSLDERITLTAQTVASREESLRIFTRRTEVGSTSRYALTQVQTLVHQAKTIDTQLRQQRDVQAHALQQLTGRDVASFAQPEPTSIVLPNLPEGLPSDLLTQRPDIMAAEYALQASHANVAAARAAFLPRIALTGSFGTASAELDGLFKNGSRSWQFMPSISLPLFDGGQRQANLDLQAVRQNMAVAQYEQSIESAMREVLDALSNRAILFEQVQILAAQRDALKERSYLAQLRYDHGASPYLDVLDAERDLLSAEQQLVQSRESLLSAQVSLYTALGGGTQLLSLASTRTSSAVSATQP